jgi:hypothetical protein
MTQGMRRQIVNLVLVVAALALVGVVVSTQRQVTTGEKDARSFNLLTAFREDDITRITSVRDGKRLVIDRATSPDAGDRSWNITEPVQEEAEAYAIDKLLGSLEFARFVRRIKPEEVNRAEFGLETPSWRIVLEMGNVHYALAFGKEAASPAGARYLELEARGGPESGVFLVSRDLVKELDIDAGALRGRQLMPYTSNQLSHVVITGSDGVERKLKSAGRDRWRFDGMQHGVRVNRDVFDQVLIQFARTKAEHFIDRAEAEAALAGGKNVRVELTPKEAGLPKGVIEVGGRCPKSENDVVALRREPDVVAACVPKSVLPGLDTPAVELVDKHLFALRKDEVESLSVVRGDKKLDLARKESGFVMRSPVQGEVELETGNRRIEAIVLAEGELVLDAKAADLGLEPPTGKITLRSSAESDEAVVEETVEIGRVGKSGKLAVRRVADGMVLELDPDAARTLEADSTLIRGLRLLDFSGSDFRSLEVRGRSVKQTIHREASGQIVLDVPAGKSADTALTGDAIHELGRLTADRWVSDVEEPSFGLASPELTVEFSFATGDAGVKDRVLTVGASTAGGAFAKLAGEPGVFVMPRRAIDALDTWFLDRTVFTVTPDVATKVEIERQGKKLTLERQGDGFVRAAGVELSPARVAEISDTLIALRAEAAVALGAAKPAQGFDKPEVTVRVERTGPGPKSFRIGVGDAWRGQSIHYVRADGVDATYVMAKTKAKVLIDAF